MLYYDKSYKFNPQLKHYDDKVHYGFIAQDIQQSLNEFNQTNVALVDKKKCEIETSEKEIIGDDYLYIVNKDELHAMHVQMIQSQQKEIESLKQQNISLEGRIAILEQIVNQLSSQINQTIN